MRGDLRVAFVFLDIKNHFYIDSFDLYYRLSGAHQLIARFKFLSELSVQNKFLFVFDCDADISELQNTDKIIAFKFDKNDKSKASKGIENLFSKELFKEEFYSKGISDYGEEYAPFHKKKFKDHYVIAWNRERFFKF